MSVGLALLVAACGQPAGPERTSSMHVHLADDPDKIAVANPVSPDPRVGPIFVGGTDLHTCTGSVVHSRGGDLILTAAHCLAAGFPTTFVPGFANAAAPLNIWTVDAVYLDPRWVAFQDPRADYAFARVSRADGGSVETQVGSALSLGTAPAPGSLVSIVGYAAGVGGMPIGCQASTGVTLGYPSLRCAGLVDGTSGAPWIINSTVTGVIGGFEHGGCTPEVSYSAPFDERTQALLTRAEAGGPGELAPTAFSGC
ncbi:MAG TPA: trypsin-like peptidase domain-containing protein [Mycobacterium sp.]|nr:trypsin-like peptidase domain-containing protein [Mycobacterium sp.]